MVSCTTFCSLGSLLLVPMTLWEAGAGKVELHEEEGTGVGQQLEGGVLFTGDIVGTDDVMGTGDRACGKEGEESRGVTEFGDRGRGVGRIRE